MNLRVSAALLVGRSAALVSRAVRGGGATSLPGLTALKIAPDLIECLASELAGIIVVTGTNGKTTTARFIGSALEAAGRPYVHNQAGSNLLRGIASSLLLNRPAASQRSRTWGLLEVDEATMPAACAALQPDVVVVTNLFRDQLDRYGELQQTAELIRGGLRQLGSESTVVLNSDDPLVASLGAEVKKPLYYGLEDTSVAKRDLPHAADVLSSQATGELLAYEAVFVGHLGHYHSSGNDITRPQLTIAATMIALRGLEGSDLTITAGHQTASLSLSVPGLYNCYNAVAAVAAGEAAGLSLVTSAKAIATTAAAFGRVEKIKVNGKSLVLCLIKNPTGTNEVVDMLALDSTTKDVLIAINDNFADGTDVSWLWDADFEPLVIGSRSLTISGNRAADMALRARYGGVAEASIHVQPTLDRALTTSLERVPAGGTLYVLPTYTAMLELRKILTQRGHLKHYLN